MRVAKTAATQEAADWWRKVDHWTHLQTNWAQSKKCRKSVETPCCCPLSDGVGRDMKLVWL